MSFAAWSQNILSKTGQQAGSPHHFYYNYRCEDEPDILRFIVHSRSMPHIRHLQKYLHVPLPEEKRFYFHDQNNRFQGLVASNLWEFKEVFKNLTLESIQFHLEREDLEKWLQVVLHDDELARQIHKIRNRKLKGEKLREALQDVVIQRYEESEAMT